VALDPQHFFALVELRRQQAEAALGAPVPVTVDIGAYPHFETPRGHGVTFIDGRRCSMRYAAKCLTAPLHRTDAIIRHELGHVLDAQQSAATLNAWAKRRGVTLAATPERRADDIAHAVWGEPLRYDEATVQSTRVGRVGRPLHLNQ
jgi:hypothetical protein